MILSEIIPNLWISNTIIDNNLKNFYNIKNIINSDKDLNSLNLHHKYNYELRDRILKYENTKKYEYFKECVKYIENNINNNGILIYSKSLVNSYCIIIIFLILKGKINFNKSLNILKSKIDKIIIIPENYKKIINKFENL